MQYQHTQRAPIHLVLYFFAAYFLYAGWLLRGQTVLLTLMLGGAAAFVLLALSFRQLAVCDDGDALGVRFGPLPLFGTRIPYDSITAVESSQSSLIDGWGIHYLPGRGWTYNLWGFDCVNVSCGRRLTRIGTDDGANLVKFLQGRCTQLSSS